MMETLPGTTLTHRRKAFKAVKELDAFPKIPESYQETTASGGGLSVFTFFIIGVLVISEIWHYSHTQLKYEFEVDKEYEGKIRMNVDITVAMKCGYIGADVLDVAEQDVHGKGELKMEQVYFELSPKQRQHLMFMQQINTYMRNQYHAIHELLWTSRINDFKTGMPPREDGRTGEFDGCRIHGSLQLNKVAGNFHITAGKALTVMGKHAHLLVQREKMDYNFSHRIDHFSFGEPVTGIVHALDGEEQISNGNYHLFQYFMKIVPTEVRTLTTYQDTYQFSVTDRNRTIDHSKGSHGVPGIFVKYDVTSIKIRVREELQPLWKLLVRLCGIIGGIFAVSGILYNFVGFMVEVLCCRFNVFHNKKEEKESIAANSLTLHSNTNSELKQPFTLMSQDVT